MCLCENIHLFGPSLLGEILYQVDFFNTFAHEHNFHRLKYVTIPIFIDPYSPVFLHILCSVS